jgi:hypothetical protein
MRGADKITPIDNTKRNLDLSITMFIVSLIYQKFSMLMGNTGNTAATS